MNSAELQIFCRTMTNRAAAASSLLSDSFPKLQDLVRRMERIQATRVPSRGRSALLDDLEAEEQLRAWEDVLDSSIVLARSLVNVCTAHMDLARSASAAICAHRDAGSPMRWHHRRTYRRMVESTERAAAKVGEKYSELLDEFPDLQRRLALHDPDD
jgi:hypothetical protein